MNRIPMTGAPGEGLLKGLDTGSNLFSRIMQPVMQQKQLQQQHAHHLNDMGLKLEQLEMQKEMFPHQIQALVDAHKLHPHQAKEMTARAESLYADAKKNIMFSNLLNGQGGNESPMAPMQNANNIQSNVDQQNVPTELMNKFSENMPQTGGETIVRQGNPNLSKLDNAPGLMGIPPVQHQTDENGNTFSYYPSGKVTMMKTGRSAEEKAQQELEKQGKQKTQELQVKEREEINKGLPILQDRLKNAQEVLTLMEKHKDKTNKWWGSPIPFQSEESALKMRKMNVKDKDFGRIETGYAEIAKDLSKDLSNNRVLASGLQFSVRNKSSFTEPYEVAKGKLEKSIDQMKQTISREKKRLGEISEDKLLETRVASNGNTYYKYSNGWDTEKR